MIIADEQIDSVREGHIIRISTDSGELVILRAETYDRIAGLLADDPCEAYHSVLSAWDAEGSPEDATAYQDLV